MSTTLKVSVSIVTYQEEDFIRQTLESVLAQKTNFPFQVIVGDDASTDDTRIILKEYSRNHPDKIKLLLPENNYGDNGLSNFISTIENCEGEYVAFLDGDDYWTDEYKLQKQVDFLDAHPECSLCSHRIIHRSSDGHDELSSRPSSGDQVYKLDALIRSNFAHKISTVARMDAVRSIPEWYGKTTIASADWVYNLLLAKKGDIAYIDSPMAVHRKRSGNLSSLYGQKRILKDRLATLDVLSRDFHTYKKSVAYARYKTKLKLAIATVSPGLYHFSQRLFCSHRSSIVSDKA